MGASDLNKDLDKYLSSRRETKEWNFFKPKKQQIHQDPMPEDLKADSVHVIHHEEQKTFWQRLFQNEKEPVSEDLSPAEMQRLQEMQEEIEDIDQLEQMHPEAYQELEQERESLIDKFMNLFRGYEHKHTLERKADELDYVEEHVVPKVDEELKEALKITHKWLGKLSKRERDNFKESNDYHRYKELLEKHGLAKSKEHKHKAAEPKQERKQSIEDFKHSVHLKGDSDYPILGQK